MGNNNNNNNNNNVMSRRRRRRRVVQCHGIQRILLIRFEYIFMCVIGTRSNESVHVCCL